MSLFNPLGYLGASRRGPPSRPPKEDIERALAQYMVIPPHEPGSDREPVISDASFHSIARYLGMLPDPKVAEHAKQRPRIFTILSLIGRVDAFSAFVKSDLTDFYLPLPEEELPPSLGRDKSEFMKTQNHCLTDGKDLEKGENGRHVVCNSSQPYFVAMHELGSGGFG